MTYNVKIRVDIMVTYHFVLYKGRLNYDSIKCEVTRNLRVLSYRCKRSE